jgi:hypothetical protein
MRRRGRGRGGPLLLLLLLLRLPPSAGVPGARLHGRFLEGGEGLPCLGRGGWMDLTVHGTGQGAWDYGRGTRKILHL